jgi:hypothetical protein
MNEVWKLGLIFMATKLAGMPCTAAAATPRLLRHLRHLAAARCLRPLRCQRKGHRQNLYIYIRLFGCKPLLLLEASEFKNANQFAAVYISVL